MINDINNYDLYVSKLSLYHLYLVYDIKNRINKEWLYRTYI